MNPPKDLEDRLDAAIEAGDRADAKKRAKHAGSNTSVVIRGVKDEIRPLPPGSVIRFRLANGVELDVFVTSDDRQNRQDPPGVLHVRSRDGRLQVQPVVSNVVYVRGEKS